MYLEYFGLDDYPFRMTPDLDYLYMSSVHSRARAYLDYSIVSRDGFVVITGEIGSGKTMLMRTLLEEMPDDAVLVHIEQTQLNAVEFLQTVLHGLVGNVDTDNKVELLQRLRTFVENARNADTRVVIAVDEAQLLSWDVLEEIRMLSDIEADKEKAISIIMMGQPELGRIIEHPRMEQLRQRVRLRFHLTGMSEAETRAYVHVRLAVAGCAQPEALFGNEVIALLHRYTGGIPRLINTLCDMALLTAFVDDHRQIDEAAVMAAVEELEWPLYSEREARAARHARPAGDERTVSALPTAQNARLAESLDRIAGSLERIVASLEQRQEADAPARDRTHSG